MPIVFEEVTGEVAPQRPTAGEAQASAPRPEADLREKLSAELALMRERAARLFAD